MIDKIRLWAVRRQWKGLSQSPDLPPEMRTVISDCLIPLFINPLKWIDNSIWLETEGMPQLRGYKDLRPSSSVKEWTRRMDRPMGVPDWFLAAFPDVALWAAIEAEDLSLIHDERALAVQGNLIARYETVYPGDTLKTPNGLLSLCYLKNLAEFYYNCLGRRPECRL